VLPQSSEGSDLYHLRTFTRDRYHAYKCCEIVHFLTNMKKPAVKSSHSPAVCVSISTGRAAVSARPVIVVGVTHPQTCLVLTGRLRRLREAGFRVILVSSPGDLLHSTAAAEGVQAIAIPMRRQIAPFADLVSLARLCRLLRRVKPAMVEFSTPKAGLLGSIAATLCGVPCRVYMLRGLKLETATGFKRRILWAAERTAAACAHRVLCNSESLRAKGISLRLAPVRKLHLLGAGSSNGVDVERFSPGPSSLRPQLGLTSDDLVIGFVGRLTRDKGLPELVAAFEVVASIEPRARLLLVGWFDAAEDSLLPGLRARIESHPRIRLTGFVPDTAAYYRAMDLTVLPTWREGFPNAALEAAATAIPVITTHSTGSRDAVVPEVTGLLVPPGVPEAIVEAVLRLLRDPERRRHMGRAARAWVLENYASERVLALTVNYYKSLLAGVATSSFASAD
jgi:glycosyltransferase involved in cell wall biosynthesis